jgi:RNA polymerase sigma-70 factor (ECF subfamily)
MSIGPSFEGVLDAARTGADWAWTTIYRDLAPAVLGYLRARGASEPEDLTSEVFVGVVRNLQDFEGDEDAFRSWVFVIAHRRLQDERRSHVRHPVDPVPPELLDQPVGNVEDEALAAVDTRHMIDTFATLSHDQREVLTLRVVADLSLEQTAEILGKSQGAVKSLQHRALAQLAKKLVPEPVSR